MDNLLPIVEFTKSAKVELANLLDFIRRQPFGNPTRRWAIIESALEQLRTMPEDPGNPGLISVRAVRHSAMHHPLRAVREVPDVLYKRRREMTYTTPHGVLAS